MRRKCFPRMEDNLCKSMGIGSIQEQAVSTFYLTVEFVKENSMKEGCSGSWKPNYGEPYTKECIFPVDSGERLEVSEPGPDLCLRKIVLATAIWRRDRES